MPITAKLSRNFYERFGDEITNEIVEWFNTMDLTYRSDFREINETNWQRFSAQLDARTELLRKEMVEMRSELKSDMAKLRSEVKSDMAEMRSEVKSEMVETRSELKAEMAEMRSTLRSETTEGQSSLRLEIRDVKADIIKWMFGFWSATMLTIFTFLWAR